MSDMDGEALPEKAKIIKEEGLGYTLTIDPEHLHQVALGFREAGFNLFLFASGIDFPESIGLIYRLYSTQRKNKISIFIKTEVPKSDPVVDSLVSIWPAADWHEREIYDLFGVTFTGHPNMRRIFMPDDWIGHPLRKDYTDNYLPERPNNF